jgi:hypothetical protein
MPREKYRLVNSDGRQECRPYPIRRRNCMLLAAKLVLPPLTKKPTTDN